MAAKALRAARDHWDFLLVVILAAVIFKPWAAQHLPLTDFGMFLAARGNSGSFFSQYAGLSSYYIGEGRFCLIIYLYLTAGAAAFGTWAAGWHWSFFVFNVAALLAARSFLLRVGVNRLAILVALALWSTMGPTAELWIRPAGEPIVLVLFFVSLHAALNFHEAEDWKKRTLIIAVCGVAIVFTKEILICLLPVVWLVSRLSYAEGEWRLAPWSGRDFYLFRVVASSVAVALVPVAYVALHASKASYAAQYSTAVPRLSLALIRLETVLVPSAPRLHWLARLGNDPAWVMIRTLPNVVWIVMIGLAVAFEKRGRILWPLAIGLTWVLLGVTAYMPWPSEGMFYMMPFALGTMFIAAHAFSRPLAKGSKHRRAVLGVASFLILVASVEARSTVDQHRLRATLNADVIDSIAARGGARVLIAALPTPQPGTGGWAHHITGFSSVSKGMRVGSWRDMSCADAKKALVETPGAVVISMAGGCGPIGDRPTVLVETVPRLRWPYLWQKGTSEGRMYVAHAAPGPRLSYTKTN
jgi:hypothetical protein